MQVAWRTLSLLHGAFMLDGAPFSADDWRYLCAFIRLHADHLLEESKDRLERQHAQNHVLQIGVALIMAGGSLIAYIIGEGLADGGNGGKSDTV